MTPERRQLCRVLASVICLAAGAARVSAQNAESVQVASERSTLTGVYTAAQASRGADTFAGMCQGCHTPASHASVAFINAWRDKPLLELFRFLRESMPKSDPGTLTAEEYAQVIAYLLKLNGMPAGAEELAADSAILKTIRFVPKK